MSRDVNELLQRTADAPTRPLDTAAVVALASLVALPLVTGDDPGLEIADGPEGPDDTGVLEERAPLAGSEASHWPVELVYGRPPADGSPEEGRRLRFRGNSWAAWTIEENWSDEGMLPPGQWSAPGGPGFDDSDTWVEDRSRWRGVSAELHAEWRSAIGLGQRVVVELEEIPGAPALIAFLGLTPDEVEAYASPNVAGCDDGSTATPRMIPMLHGLSRTWPPASRCSPRNATTADPGACG